MGWLPAVIVLVAVAIGYANATGASFQFDDWDVIVRDPRVQDVASWWAAMPGMRPLLKLSYALNHASGWGVRGFHAVNVLIHAANGLLVLALFRRFLRQLGQPEVAAGWMALAAALVFVLHPVQTEAVTYASGRSASLSVLFAFGSLAAWAEGRARGNRLLALVVSPGLMLAGIATKETAVIVPAVLLLWAAADVSRPWSWRDALRATAVHW
ncbi:MAG: hypothetical protein J0M16_12990, partial [Gammaproteobacteria bacterium]|nr:hypothetical protein [Gammaproteobacteria bacterium]